MELTYNNIDENDSKIVADFLKNGERRDFCLSLVNTSLNNPKGDGFDKRFIDIVSDPNNLYIPRVPDAGNVYDNIIIMHNGIKVSRYGYYEEFSDILVRNGGCHEPSEERMFSEVLRYIPENGTMIELGSYWAFYSIWFHTHTKNARNYCIEPSMHAMKVGKENCALNKVTTIDFTEAAIGKNHLCVSEFVKQKGIDFIDILHSDIQGSEGEMIDDIVDLLKAKKIRYLFISTHSNELHAKCLRVLDSCDYRIIATADFETETFCYDGIIVACQKKNLDIPFTELGVRKYTPLRKHPLYPRYQ